MRERLEEIKSRVWKERCTYAVGDDSSREGYSYTLSDEDYHWLMEQAERYEDLLEQVKQIEKVSDYNADLRMKYEKALEYIQRAIYTQHCTKNHKWNTEFEKGQISGLIQASNIVEKAIERMEESK